MLCEACGNDNRTGSRFCDRCGSPLSLSCPACGEPNRGDAAFCAACGTALNRATAPTVRPSAERRQVSVLFVDLVGFTSFAEGRDPERVRAVQQEYFDVATDAITRHGGTVEKFVGDAVMAVWGTPTAHEDDAQRAVRAGLEIVRAVEALGHQLQARAGVVTGQAAVTLGATNQGMVAGDMVNTAARLQAAAEPGHVLADQATVQATRGAIGFETLDGLQLKGKAEPVRAWRATRVQPASTGDVVDPPFVGRAHELSRLKELLHATQRDGRIRLVSIVGPAGIGKTRLVAELGSYADGLVEPTVWHAGRSPSYGEGLAFWALGEMVRRRAGLAEGDDDDRTREAIATTLDELVAAEDERAWLEPALRTLLGIGESMEAESLFAAWRVFFERVAERGTAVLVFEDLQWADAGTLQFIEHLLDWSRNQPMLVITLARPELLDARPGWGTGRSNATAMALEPLPAADMEALLLGMLPGLPEGQVSAIVERAGGMPLYMVEIVRGLLAEGRIERRGSTFEPTGDLASLPIPASLRSLIASRLDALPSDDRALLQDASVLGLVFSVEALASISGPDVEELRPRLVTLVRREILEIEADPRSPERGQFRFVQSLIREIAYETLSMRDRRSRHLAAARYLEGSESEEAAGALATHYVAAHRASDEGPEADAIANQARIALRAAAERAAALGAHSQALSNLESALVLTNDRAERAALLERAAHAAMVSGAPTGPDFARQAREAWRSAGEDRLVGRATALWAETLIYATRMDEAMELLERETAALSEDPDTEVAARLFASLARIYMRLDRNSEALAAAERALPLAEAARLEDVTATALVNKGSAMGQLGRQRESAALISGGLGLARRLGLTREELRAALNLANTVVDDDPIDARRIIGESLETARRVGDFWFTSDFTQFAAGIDFCIGTPAAWERATSMLDEALARVEDEVAILWLSSTRISFTIARGENWRDPLAVIERAETIDRSNPVAAFGRHFTRAEVALVQRDWDLAIAEARAAMEVHRFIEVPLGPILGHAASRVGDVGALRWLDARLREHGSAGAQSTAVRGRIAGALDALEGREADAEAHFAAALATYESLGLRWEWARTVLDGLAALPNSARLKASVPEARAVFEAIGAARFVALLDEAAKQPAPEPNEDERVPAQAADTAHA